MAIHLRDKTFYDEVGVYVVLLLQESSRAPGSPTSLRVPPNGGCEDLDMETEEEDDLRARGQLIVAFRKLYSKYCHVRSILNHYISINLTT